MRSQAEFEKRWVEWVESIVKVGGIGTLISVMLAAITMLSLVGMNVAAAEMDFVTKEFRDRIGQLVSLACFVFCLMLLVVCMSAFIVGLATVLIYLPSSLWVKMGYLKPSLTS